jgi:hypothetical protein
MWIARMTCSDPDCPDELEAVVDDVRELEALACACGCTMAVVAWPDRTD